MATTIWSGMSDVFSNNVVKILTKGEMQKRIAQVETKRKRQAILTESWIPRKLCTVQLQPLHLVDMALV